MPGCVKQKKNISANIRKIRNAKCIIKVWYQGFSITNITATSINAYGTFVFNGGTLKPTVSKTTFWVNSTQTTASITNGGAIIDTAGYDITIAQPLLHAAGATNDFLLKLGAGALTLSGANTYSGDTTVSNGVLVVAVTGNLVDSTNVTVCANNGGWLTLLNDLAISSNACMYINSGSGKVTINAGVTSTVWRLYIDGQNQNKGTWGSDSSGARHVNNACFQGDGVLMVRDDCHLATCISIR